MESAVLQNSTSDLLEVFSYSLTETEESPHYARSLPARILICLLMFLCAILGCLGNGAVIVVSFTSERLKAQPGNVLVAYLAFTDFLASLFITSMSGISVAADRWPLGEVFCRVHSFLIHVLIPASSLTLAFIGLDRLFAVSRPFQYVNWMTKTAMYAACAIISLVSAAVGFVSVYDKEDLIKYLYLEMVCIADYASVAGKARRDFAFTVFVSFYAPAAVIAVSYTVTVILARRSRNAVHPVPAVVNGRDFRDTLRQQDRNGRKVIKSMIFVAVVFFFAYIVSVSLKCYELILKNDPSPWAHVVATLLMQYSSTVNPLIYAILRKDFREALIKLFKQVLRAFYSDRF